MNLMIKSTSKLPLTPVGTMPSKMLVIHQDLMFFLLRYNALVISVACISLPDSMALLN